MLEPMGWPPRTDDELASVLVDLAHAVAFPPTPALATGVGFQLRAGTGSRWLRSAGLLGRPTRWTLGRAAALGLVAVLAIAGAALAFGIVIGGLKITFAPGTPPPLPSGVVQSRSFGEEIGLEGARERAGFTIVLPTLSSVGAPDHVYFLDFPSGGTISLVWGTRPGYPEDAESRVGLVITEFAANVAPAAWEKLLFQGTTVTQTQVQGDPAYWVAGGYHEFFYRDATGTPVDTSLRMVGSALLWERNGLVLRVEGAPSLDTALEVAGSLR
jgi:hypothetical protein